VKINGKKAVVVGGASGMARATAEQLSERGAQVAILDLPTSAGAERPSRSEVAPRFMRVMSPTTRVSEGDECGVEELVRCISG
jgi:NAD(P)-dependent dehydrogenase (short-subunit alcohol dehydrogenase family)